jgi:hypothetical protein
VVLWIELQNPTGMWIKWKSPAANVLIRLVKFGRKLSEGNERDRMYKKKHCSSGTQLSMANV